MAGEWPTSPLGLNARKIGSGATPRGGKDAYLDHGPYALIRSQNVHDFQMKLEGLAYIDEAQASALDGVAVQTGDVLVNITGDSVARVCMVDERVLPARVNQHVAIVRADPTAFDQRFISYALVSPSIKARLLGLASAGATRNALTKADLENFSIPCPRIAEQQTVAGLLGAFDDKIELNRRMTETLEATARALFKGWFVDFDPVRAKAEGRPTGLSDRIAELFPDSFDEEGIPDGWVRRPLHRVVTQNRDTVDPTALGEALVEHFSLPAFDAGTRPVKEAAAAIKSLKLSVTAPTILFSKLNPDTPRVWPVLSQSANPMVASTEFLALRPSGTDVPFSFVEALLTSASFRDKAAGMVTGTSKSHQRVQPKALLSTEWLVAPAPVLAAFDTIASALLERRVTLIAESASLASLRNALLPKLISGELRIGDAEQAVAEVA